jgi:hypothetical protein
MPVPAHTTHLNSLSEDEVKHRFVPFLKDFYKNRYQSDPGSIQVQMDNVSAEGWVADGKLTFRKPDDSLFICTYEATSRDKAEEVKYKLNTHYFLWDCIAFGSVCAALFYMLFFQTQRMWLIQLKGIGNLGLLLGLFIIGFFSWYFVMQRWRKYRYIFAIQQFRQYFADEQWVALAEDVFPAPNDPYYLELRNQCVYHGIGLAIVPFEGVVRKINDPSRLGIYGKDKKMADWVTRAQWYQNMSSNVSAMAARRPKAPDALTAMMNKMFRPLHYLLLDPFKKYVVAALRKPFGETTSAYTRFMSAQSVQKWVAFLALALIVPVFWTIASYKTEEIADLEALQQWKGGKNPEDERGYLVDGEAIPYDGNPTGVPKQYPLSAKSADEDGPTIDMSGDEDSDDGPTIDMSGDEEEEDTPVAPVVKKTTPAKAVKPAPKITSACAQLNRSGWIIQESAFAQQPAAAARAKLLQEKGVNCQFAAQTCLPNSKNTGYLVWLGAVHATESAANKTAESLTKTLRTKGLLKGKLFVRALKK